jgi:hypothetical protein
VIAAVAVVLMVQMTGDEVVHVIAVGDGLVPAPGPVDVTAVVTLAVLAAAAARVAIADRKHVLVLVVAVRAVQVPVVDVVEVALVDDGDVTAAGAVHVLVAAFVDVVLVSHAAKLAREPAAREPPLMGTSRDPRAAHRPAGCRTLKPREERAAACQRVPACRCPEVSKRSPATTMYMCVRFA